MSKWAMHAKAYSIECGSREKGDAPLDDYFKICAPLIEVIPPRGVLACTCDVLGSLGKARVQKRETCSRRARPATGVKFQCAVNAAAGTVTLIPLEPMSPMSVAASVSSQVGSPTKSTMPGGPQQAQALSMLSS